jgi:putative phosphonate metabolism protein
VSRLYSVAMTNGPRYAIYYASEADSELDRFGKQLLGYDAYTGEQLSFPEGIVQKMPDWRDLTLDPRKYGFHATLKAPLILAPGRNEAALMAACQGFADTARPLPVIEPVVDSISGFVALVPAAPSAELAQLADDCVRAFDLFRAPLTAEDRARRQPADLTPRQREHLDRWGYPYVMEDFRFHMTLTGRLAAARRAAVLAMLRESFSAIGLKTLTIDRIAVFRQADANSRFRVVNSWKLRIE